MSIWNRMRIPSGTYQHGRAASRWIQCKFHHAAQNKNRHTAHEDLLTC